MKSRVAIANAIEPNWPAPANVRALVTTRVGGCSVGPYASNNLGDHVDDLPEHVAANRAYLIDTMGIGQIQWLQQVHGTEIVEADPAATPAADGAITSRTGLACAVLTADCLPILLCDRRGRRVAAVHAGWRGLASGILPLAIERLGVAAENLLVYLGPAISARHFEVGGEVKEAFVGSSFGRSLGPKYLRAVAAEFTDAGRPGHFFADLYQLARHQCSAVGVDKLFGGEYCTYADQELFYSYRRDGCTGRMASLIWLQDP